MYRLSFSVHELFPYSYSRGSSVLQFSSRGGAQCGSYHDPYGFGSRVRGFESQHFGGPHFPHRCTRLQHASVDLHALIFAALERMTQYWIPKKFLSNPNTELSTYYSSHM